MAALVEFSRLSLSVGTTQLLEDASVQVLEGDVIALVGPNGCGKSTLLRCMANKGDGYWAVGSGSIGGSLHGAADGSVLHVEQDDLRWGALVAVEGVAEDELRGMTVSELLDFAAASGDAAALEDADAWRELSVAARDVLGWGAAGYEDTPVGQLSPGSAVRAFLAVALRRNGVGLVLLDEPTNHLDLPSVLWLQEMIVECGKTVVMVSHDAAFLDAVATRLWDIDPVAHSLTATTVSFSDHARLKALARERQREAHEQQQKRHQRLSAAADRMRVASARGARHEGSDRDKLQRDFRRDRAGRSGRKAKALEARRDAEERVERVVDRKPLRIAVDYMEAGPDAVLLLGTAKLGYAGRALPLAPVSMRVDFGERVAIVGFNGVGKTTLLRTLVGDLPPLQGDVVLGRGLRIGNLRQEHESMPREQSARVFLANATGMNPFTAGQRAIGYGLSLQQVDCPIATLNPGARARALLAAFSLRKVNALVLDEPTNHLDEEAVGELLMTLNDFAGTVLVVSHSRAFLRALNVTRTLLLSPRGLQEIDGVDSFEGATVDDARRIVRSAGP